MALIRDCFHLLLVVVAQQVFSSFFSFFFPKDFSSEIKCLSMDGSQVDGVLQSHYKNE